MNGRSQGDQMTNLVTEEILRLHGATPTSSGDRILIRIPVQCEPGSPEIVLSRVTEVMKTVSARTAEGGWPELQEWKAILPEWFLRQCADEQTRAEVEQWLSWLRSLPPEERAAAEANAAWTLADWLYWFEPGPNQRQWRWWKGEVRSDTDLNLILAIDGWPTAHGAFDWIVRAAGAMPLGEEPFA